MSSVDGARSSMDSARENICDSTDCNMNCIFFPRRLDMIYLWRLGLWQTCSLPKSETSTKEGSSQAFIDSTSIGTAPDGRGGPYAKTRWQADCEDTVDIISEVESIARIFEVRNL